VHLDEHVLTEIADNDSDRDEDNQMIEIPRPRVVNQSAQPRHRFAWNESRASKYLLSENEESKRPPSKLAHFPHKFFNRKEASKIEKLNKHWEEIQKEQSDEYEEIKSPIINKEAVYRIQRNQEGKITIYKGSSIQRLRVSRVKFR